MKDRPNKIPQPQTIARHYAQGEYCDYPADILMSAVNSHDHPYNPTAIPIRLCFQQMLVANFNAFAYLAEHNSQEEIKKFLADPNGFMTDAGVELKEQFDERAPKIFAAMVEGDMLEALKSEDDIAVCRLVGSYDKSSWPHRHTERYPAKYMRRDYSSNIEGIPYLYDELAQSYGFTRDFSIDLGFILRHFSEK